MATTKSRSRARPTPTRTSAATVTTRAKDDPLQRFIMRMPRELHRQLRFLSVDRGVSLNSLIVEALERWWREQPEHGKYPAG